MFRIIHIQLLKVRFSILSNLKTYRNVSFVEKLLSESDTSLLDTNQVALSGIDLRLFDSVNTKLTRLSLKLNDLQIERFTDTWLQLCRLANNAYHTNLQLFRIDPSLGARVLLQSDTISAEFVSPEIIMVWHCQPMTPTHVFYNHTVNSTCYAYLPILVREKLYFVIPGSADLIANSPVIPCHHQTISIFHSNGTFRTANGPIHVFSIFPITPME